MKRTTATPEPAPTFPTSIVGPCGRFIVPLENATTAAFYGAARVLGAEPSELLAEAVHGAILAAIAAAKGKGGAN